MPPLSRVLLLHRAGCDREVLAGFLRGAGHDVLTCDNLAELRARVLDDGAGQDRAAIIQVQAAPEDGDYTFLHQCPSLTLGNRRLAPRGAVTEHLDDPCFLVDLRAGLQRLIRGEPPEELPRDSLGGQAPPQSQLLRGVAHALSNPLSAARGWLQLLSVAQEPRYLDRMAKELARIEQITHSLSLLGRGSSGMTTPLDLGKLLRPRVRRLAADGLAVTLQTDRAPDARIQADPAEWELMFDLLLSSLHEDRGRIASCAISLIRLRAALCIEVRAEGVTLPEDLDLEHLGGLLVKRIRHTRALALALARLLVVDQLAGSIRLQPTGSGQGTSIVLEVPACAVAESEA